MALLSSPGPTAAVLPFSGAARGSYGLLYLIFSTPTDTQPSVPKIQSVAARLVRSSTAK